MIRAFFKTLYLFQSFLSQSCLRSSVIDFHLCMIYLIRSIINLLFIWFMHQCTQLYIFIHLLFMKFVYSITYLFLHFYLIPSLLSLSIPYLLLKYFILETNQANLTAFPFRELTLLLSDMNSPLNCSTFNVVCPFWTIEYLIKFAGLLVGFRVRCFPPLGQWMSLTCLKF